MVVIVIRLMLLGVLAVVQVASATQYYISPSGSDGNNGLSQGAPWLTFNHAIPLLQAGDTLFFMNGVFIQSVNGVFQPQCGVSANNGSSGNPITIKALNERQVRVQGDGSKKVADFINCSYWTIEGIYWTSADNVSGQGGDGSVFVIENSDHFVIRKNVFAFTNRYFNSHLVEVLYDSDFNVIEDNEGYSTNRHGILLYADGLGAMPDSNVVRRNYLNSRDYGNIPGGWTVGTVPDRGATGISCYPCRNNIFENNIVENFDAGFDLQCKGDCTDNKYYGNVNKNTAFGFGSNGRSEVLGCCDVRMMPTRTVYKDHVSLNADRSNSILAIHRATKDVIFEHITLADSTNQTWFMDHNGSDVGDNAPSFTAHDVLVMNVDDQGGSFDVTTWSVDRLRSYNVPGWSPGLGDGHYTNVTTSDPGMGTCRVFIPATSNLKGAGTGGTDIGANIVNRYQDGILTMTPLWDTVTGKFPCGASIAGVNDIAGSSCTDVNERLNVNFNGCTLPSVGPADITSGLLSRWTFDGSYSDIGSNQQNGSAVGGETFDGSGNCKVGSSCRVFSGSPQYVSVVQSGKYNLHASAFSIAAWVKDDTSAATLFATANHRIVSWYDGVLSIALTLGSQDGVVREFKIVNLNVAGVAQRSTPVGTGWHHVVVTFDGSSTYHVYVDGVLADGSGATDIGVYTGDSMTLYIGQQGSGNPDAFVTGSLDDIRIYGRVLSSTDVAALAVFNEVVSTGRYVRRYVY